MIRWASITMPPIKGRWGDRAGKDPRWGGQSLLRSPIRAAHSLKSLLNPSAECQVPEGPWPLE